MNHYYGPLMNIEIILDVNNNPETAGGRLHRLFCARCC